MMSTIINYVDRQTLSVLAPYLKSDYGWNNGDFAKIVISFRLAYAIGQSVCGRLMDRLVQFAREPRERTGLSARIERRPVVGMTHRETDVLPTGHHEGAERAVGDVHRTALRLACRGPRSEREEEEYQWQRRR